MTKNFDLNETRVKHHFYNQLSVMRTKLANMDCGCEFSSLDPQCEFCVFRDGTIGIFDICLIDLGKNTDWRSKFARNLMDYSRDEIKYNDIISLQRESVLFNIGLSYAMENRPNAVSSIFWNHYHLAMNRIDEFFDSFKNLPASMSNLVI